MGCAGAPVFSMLVSLLLLCSRRGWSAHAYLRLSNV
jgi:hypothetical protein